MSRFNTANFVLSPKAGQEIFGAYWLPEQSAVRDIVVLVHGLGEHSGRYAHWAEKFCAQGIGVYALDLLGHGRSGGKRGHTDSFEVLFDAMERLVGVARNDHPEAALHLYGHSMGGAVVLGSVIGKNLNPTSVIITGPAIAPGFEPPKWKINLALFLDKYLPTLVLGNELDITGVSRDPKVIAAYSQDPLVHSKLSVRWFNEWLRCVDQIKRHAMKFAMPMLILHGAKDRLTSPKAADELAQLIGPSATFKLWPEAFHELHNEPDQDDVFAFIIDWLRQRR